MNFTNTQYLPHIIIGSIAFSILIVYLNHKYFKWVKTYWFFERTWLSRFSTVLYVLSLFLMLASLLDLRGPEEKVKTNLPDQKTIIILDSSSSMLAEDIRPSRFGKAIQLARHFVKNAAGHQISVVLFSDIQKRLIPFTDDIDLLDSRLAALEKTNAVAGGSNIGQAIVEAVGYFDTDGDRKTAQGNILVFTDAEESDGSFDVDLGNNINLAVVGIGTAKGANIPLRWEDGSFRGYKTNKGEPVITKLDEDYIKKIGKNVKNYKYWIANSYSLPTDDVKNFFRGIYNKSNGKSDMRVRPVFSHLILIPAIIMFCVSIVLGRFASFKMVASFLLIAFLSVSGGVHAQDEGEEKKEKPIEKKF
jgi:Ca-activated chloride channel family protein